MSSVTATTEPAGTRSLERVQLEIGGMTWASCSARIERKLNKLGGGGERVNLRPRPGAAHVFDCESGERLDGS